MREKTKELVQTKDKKPPLKIRRAETAAWSFDCPVPGNVSVGPAGGAWARSNCSDGEEVAGSRTGELLEEGGEGALTGHCPGLECLSYWIWQAGLKRSQVKKSINNIPIFQYSNSHNCMYILIFMIFLS